MEKEELFQKRMMELSEGAYQRGIVLFSDFLDLNEQNIIENQNHKYDGITVERFGGYELAERQMAAFIPDALSYEWNYPMNCIHISPQSIKFAEPLSHRDYLGAVLSLGIERSKLGDLFTDEEGAYLFCCNKMTPFLLTNLDRVKHTMISITQLDCLTKLPQLNMQVLQGTVASVRLDAVLALAFQSSRTSMLPYIETGKVFINGKRIISNGYILKEKDIISVRGKGKFVFRGILAQTKKERFRIELDRYQ